MMSLFGLFSSKKNQSSLSRVTRHSNTSNKTKSSSNINPKLFNTCSNANKSKGEKYENKVAKYIGRKVEIENRGKVYPYGERARHVEIDIETRTTAIEVKSGKASGLKKQLDRYSDVTTKEPVALAPNMRYEAKRQTRNHYKVFDSKRELRNYLLSKGDGKNGRRK